MITPGNYGEAFARELPGIDLTYEMKCSNYVGETLDLAEELGIRGILFIAHIGKFIKVSGGIMNTHSRSADARAELMAAAAFRARGRPFGDIPDSGFGNHGGGPGYPGGGRAGTVRKHHGRGVQKSAVLPGSAYAGEPQDRGHPFFLGEREAGADGHGVGTD